MIKLSPVQSDALTFTFYRSGLYHQQRLQILFWWDFMKLHWIQTCQFAKLIQFTLSSISIPYHLIKFLLHNLNKFLHAHNFGLQRLGDWYTDNTSFKVEWLWKFWRDIDEGLRPRHLKILTNDLDDFILFLSNRVFPINLVQITSEGEIFLKLFKLHCTYWIRESIFQIKFLV